MEEKRVQKKELIHDFDSSKKKEQQPMVKPLIFTIIIMIVLGVGTGYIASNVSGSGKKGPVSISGNESASGEIKKGATFGVSDAKNFPDSVEGLVKEGGVDGEGEFHLERPGGESQNVYMTSSAVDLSKFVGKKVKVWGQTQTAQKAGWLMDVGKVEVK